MASAAAADARNRNLLVCGNPDIGKTSLLIALARGHFLPVVPKRFEGWTVNVSPFEAVEDAAELQPTLKRTTSGNNVSNLRNLRASRSIYR